jgi:hypothetical protein
MRTKCRVCFTLKLMLEMVNGLMVYFGRMKRKSNCWNSITLYYFAVSIIWHLQRWSYLPGDYRLRKAAVQKQHRKWCTNERPITTLQDKTIIERQQINSYKKRGQSTNMPKLHNGEGNSTLNLGNAWYHPVQIFYLIIHNIIAKFWFCL